MSLASVPGMSPESAPPDVTSIVAGVPHSSTTTSATSTAQPRVGVPVWRRYVELTKPALSSLVLVTTAIGFWLGGGAIGNPAVAFDWTLMILAVAGTALVAGAANAMNQCVEIRWDRQMVRTQNRPLADGTLSVGGAWVFASVLAVVGLALLTVFVNVLTAGLALLALLSYTVAYTPLKRQTTLSTIVGAVPGALPAAMGWTAATGEWSQGAWILFGIVFVWQVPHFLAISWLYQRDYDEGGFQVLSSMDRSGVLLARLMLLYTLALIPITLLPSLIGMTGALYLLGALVLGLAFLGSVAQFQGSRTLEAARRVFLASILYLPLLLGVMAVDRIG